jgi:predicted Zn-dependent protease
MSFDLICKGCGAPSSPSTGTCPFCKSIMTAVKGRSNPLVGQIQKYYLAGNLTQALALANVLYKEKNKKSEGLAFLMTFVKILFETEAPSYQINAVLGKAFMLYPENGEILDYLELMQAKELLIPGKEDDGEVLLKNILRRSPKNPHVLFTLGAHSFLIDNEVEYSLRYLEKCVSYRKSFLRAWACLGTLYKSVGQKHLANKAYKEAIKLENDKDMKIFLKEQLS